MMGVKANDRGHFIKGGGRAPKPSDKHKSLGSSGGKQGVTRVNAAPRVGVSKSNGK